MALPECVLQTKQDAKPHSISQIQHAAGLKSRIRSLFSIEKLFCPVCFLLARPFQHLSRSWLQVFHSIPCLAVPITAYWQKTSGQKYCPSCVNQVTTEAKLHLRRCNQERNERVQNWESHIVPPASVTQEQQEPPFPHSSWPTGSSKPLAEFW